MIVPKTGGDIASPVLGSGVMVLQGADANTPASMTYELQYMNSEIVAPMPHACIGTCFWMSQTSQLLACYLIVLLVCEEQVFKFQLHDVKALDAQEVLRFFFNLGMVPPLNLHSGCSLPVRLSEIKGLHLQFTPGHTIGLAAQSQRVWRVLSKHWSTHQT